MTLSVVSSDLRLPGRRVINVFLALSSFWNTLRACLSIHAGPKYHMSCSFQGSLSLLPPLETMLLETLRSHDIKSALRKKRADHPSPHRQSGNLGLHGDA